MGRPGFEPGTNRLKAEYSTVELATRINYFLDNVDKFNTDSLKLARGFRKKDGEGGQVSR